MRYCGDWWEVAGCCLARGSAGGVRSLQLERTLVAVSEGTHWALYVGGLAVGLGIRGWGIWGCGVCTGFGGERPGLWQLIRKLQRCCA